MAIFVHLPPSFSIGSHRSGSGRRLQRLSFFRSRAHYVMGLSRTWSDISSSDTPAAAQSTSCKAWDRGESHDGSGVGMIRPTTSCSSAEHRYLRMRSVTLSPKPPRRRPLYATAASSVTSLGADVNVPSSSMGPCIKFVTVEMTSSSSTDTS